MTSPESAKAPTPHHVQQQNLAISLLWAGLVVAIGGGVVAGLTWPGTEAGIYGTDETGSAIGVMCGLIVAGLGTLCALAGLIAWAVRIGIESVGPKE
ncbi:hypothetical protein [Nocardioides sp.]|uniref:hypothetical protein n=1 Tax=Nocardioides sp. TaxID=35761 RepID=UPI002632562A|nr:hypothetical protein [Nocardioides sp.]